MNTLKEIKQDYLDTFQSRSGERVLEDMKKSYHDLSMADDDDNLEHIPPEFRVWFLEGRRAVYLNIVGMLKLEIEEQENEIDTI